MPAALHTLVVVRSHMEGIDSASALVRDAHCTFQVLTVSTFCMMEGIHDAFPQEKPPVSRLDPDRAGRAGRVRFRAGKAIRTRRVYGDATEAGKPGNVEHEQRQRASAKHV